MSALDTVIEISPSIPWGSAWLDRSLPAFEDSALYFQQALSVCVTVVAFYGVFRTRGLAKQLKKNPSDRASIMKQVEGRVLIVSRTTFYVSNILLFAMFLIAGVDAYISLVSLKSDVQTHLDMWTPTFVLELAGLTAGLLALFSAIFVLVPFVQVCLAFYLLTRFARKKGESTLARYIIEARAGASSMAFMWASTCFLIQSSTSPINGGIWRWVFLQGAVGSAVAWLDASYALNFCADRLKDREIELSTAGVKDVVAMFGKAVVAVHSRGERDALLPKYEAAEQQTTYLDEKSSA